MPYSSKLGICCHWRKDLCTTKTPHSMAEFSKYLSF